MFQTPLPRSCWPADFRLLPPGDRAVLEVDGMTQSSTSGPAVRARAHHDLGLSLGGLFRFGVTEL
jgi:hypothetical protein